MLHRGAPPVQLIHHLTVGLHHLGSCLMYRQKVGINLFDRLVWKANQLILRNIKLFLHSLPQGCFNALHYLILLQLLNGFRHYKSVVHVGCLLPVCTAVIFPPVSLAWSWNVFLLLLFLFFVSLFLLPVACQTPSVVQCPLPSTSHTRLPSPLSPLL